jgi:hypothetical protein
MATAGTTRAAFKTIGPMATTLQEEILQLLRLAGPAGLIGDEVRGKLLSLGMKDGSLNTRYSELERKGLIFRNGETRRATSGRMQMVMRAAEFAESVPIVAAGIKPRRNPFLSGLMFAARLVAKSPDLDQARKALRVELIKAARKTGA